MYKIKYIILLLWVVSSCSPSRDKTVNEVDNLNKFPDEPIVLFNISDSLSRQQFAIAINSFNNCNPKVIGLCVIFEGLKSFKGDSILATSIRESGKVVLYAELENDSLITSHDSFRNNILGEGILVFGRDEKGLTTRFIAYYEEGNVDGFAFPLMLAEIYDHKKSQPFSNSIWVNREYDIDFKRSLHDFIVYEYEDLPQINCADVEGKIVIFGYLGLGEFYKHKTPLDKGNSTTYSTVIIANMVLTILNYSEGKDKR